MKSDSIGTVREVYDGVLTSDLQVNTFRHTERLFPVRTVKRGAAVLPLPPHGRGLGNVEFVSAGKRRDLVDYMALNRVTGLLVLKNGEIAFEDYEMGNDRHTRWMSMSMAKTVTSTLLGMAIHEGFIGSLDDDVPVYLPQLGGSAFDGVSLRHLLEMASGVKWDETYTDPASDRRRMLDAQIAQRPGAILELMAQLPRAAAPGTVWNYSTGETFVAGAVVAAATHRSLAEYLSERVWARLGMESDATWWLESPGGLEIGGSGLAATLRDYGRFGLFLMLGGRAAGANLLPKGWIHEAGSIREIGGRPTAYGYMIWPLGRLPGVPLGDTDDANEGAFEAVGIFGQHLYVNPREGVVIVVWSAQPKPTGTEVIADRDFFAAVARALR